MVLTDSNADAEVEEAWLKRVAAGAAEDARVDVWPVDERGWEIGKHLHGHPLRAADQEGVVRYAAASGMIED